MLHSHFSHPFTSSIWETRRPTLYVTNMIFYLRKVFVLCDCHEFHFIVVFDLALWLRTDETHKQMDSLSKIGKNVVYLSTTRENNNAWKWMVDKTSEKVLVIQGLDGFFFSFIFNGMKNRFAFKTIASFQ